MLVKVNIRLYMTTGGVCWWTRDGCLVTEGFVDNDPNAGWLGRVPRVGPQFFVGIVDRYTGRPAVALPTPRISDRGEIAPEEAVPVGQIVVTEEEAQKILRQVAFSFDQENVDIEALINSVASLSTRVPQGEDTGRMQASQPSDPSPVPVAGAGPQDAGRSTSGFLSIW